MCYSWFINIEDVIDHIATSSISESLCIVQVGLVEKEWLDTLATINSEQVTFTDYVESGRALAAQLKSEVSCIGLLCQK